MVPAKLRFHCAARLDPVTPIIVKAALTGWEAKQGQVDLAIERSFKAQELVLRMKWRITADAKKATKVVKRSRKLGAILKMMSDARQLR